jgi:hypothetical protein
VLPATAGSDIAHCQLTRRHGERLRGQQLRRVESGCKDKVSRVLAVQSRSPPPKTALLLKDNVSTRSNGRHEHRGFAKPSA